MRLTTLMISIISTVFLFSNSVEGSNSWVEINQSNSHIMGNTGYSVFEDSDGLIWWLCNQGVCVYDNDVCVAEYTPSDMGDNDPWIHASGMCEDTNGDKYISIEGGVAKLTMTNWTLYTKENSPLQDNICSDVKIDNNGVVWMSNQRGVVSLDPAGNWTSYDGSNTPMSSSLAKIINIVVDSKGKLWFLGRDTEQHSGLISFDGTDWEGHIIEGVQSAVTWMDMCITEDDIIWLAGLDGLYSYNTELGHSTNYNQDIGYKKITSCCYDPHTDDIWAGMLNDEYASVGAVQFDGVEWKHHPVINGPFLENADIYGISTDSSGSIWFSQYFKGFMKLDRGVNNINENQVCKEINLTQNYPNPFNPETTISYSLTKQENVTLAVFNSQGQLVKELVNNSVKSGQHSIKFNGAELNSGVYYYRLTTGKNSFTKKMLLVK